MSGWLNTPKKRYTLQNFTLIQHSLFMFAIAQKTTSSFSDYAWIFLVINFIWLIEWLFTQFWFYNCCTDQFTGNLDYRKTYTNVVESYNRTLLSLACSSCFSCMYVFPLLLFSLECVIHWCSVRLFTISCHSILQLDKNTVWKTWISVY